MAESFAGTWDIDPIHSRIGFSSRHAMVTRVRGAFNEFTGRVVFDPEDPSASRAEVHVDMSSVDTRNAGRDEHLCGPDFFDVEKYPTMDFLSTQIEEVDDNGFIVTGDLTIHGITRSMSIPLSCLGIEQDSFGSVRAGFEGTRRINRRDWGVTWNTPLDSGGLMISDKITLEFELSLVRADGAPVVEEDNEAHDGWLREHLANQGAESQQHEPARHEQAPWELQAQQHQEAWQHQS